MPARSEPPTCRFTFRRRNPRRKENSWRIGRGVEKPPRDGSRPPAFARESLAAERGAVADGRVHDADGFDGRPKKTLHEIWSNARRGGDW